MSHLNNQQIRYAFLAAAYYELFGNCPEPEVITQLTIKKTVNGQ